MVKYFSATNDNPISAINENQIPQCFLSEYSSILHLFWYRQYHVLYYTYKKQSIMQYKFRAIYLTMWVSNNILSNVRWISNNILSNVRCASSNILNNVRKASSNTLSNVNLLGQIRYGIKFKKWETQYFKTWLEERCK